MPTDFTLHTKDTAPEASKPLLDQSVKSFGMIPNLHAVMAEAPSVLDGYHHLWDLTLNHTAFTNEEAHVLFQANNTTNKCHYCVPAHFGLSLKSNLDPEEARRLALGEPLTDPKLEALRRFAAALIEHRGHVPDDQIQAFLDAGYTRQHMLDAVTFAACKVMSNYTNALADTPLDAPFQPAADKLAAQPA